MAILGIESAFRLARTRQQKIQLSSTNVILKYFKFFVFIIMYYICFYLIHQDLNLNVGIVFCMDELSVLVYRPFNSEGGQMSYELMLYDFLE